MGRERSGNAVPIDKPEHLLQDLEKAPTAFELELLLRLASRRVDQLLQLRDELVQDIDVHEAEYDQERGRD